MKPRHLLLTAAACCLAVVLLSCRDGGPFPLSPDTRPTVNASKAAEPHGLLPCRPLASDAVTQRIGTQGGTIRVSRHILSIPRHALSRPVDITVVAPSDKVNRLEFQPEGLVFRYPASLTMSYQNCSASVQTKGIAHTTDSLLIVEYVPSRDDAVGQKVTGQLSHFSTYAVSW